MSTCKVFIYPANNNENQYVNIQETAIRNAGCTVTYSLKDFFKIDYFLLNWFETLGGNRKIDYMKKCFKLFMLKLFHKKVLFVLHNKKPHTKSKNDKYSNLSIKLMKKLLKISYKIIILCDESKNVLKSLCKDKTFYEQKIFKIQHPNYIGVYPVTKKEFFSLSNDSLKILYIGQINQYKNIDLLINAVNSLEDYAIHLHIAGNCKNEEYKEYLLQSAINKNISFDFRFIPDTDLVNIMTEFDIIVLPYSYESSLNSGTIFLAFSYKKTVIAPMIGTLKEFSDKSFFYGYDYKNDAEHQENLTKKILEVYNDYKCDNKILLNKGEVAYKNVLENNSLKKISDLYTKLLI